MISITKKFEFEAAHFLPDHPGLCKNLHGHTYKLEVEIVGDINDDTGMIIDFGELKSIVNEKVISVLDHKCINEVFKFVPTAENMAIWIAHSLIEASLNVVRIRLYETSNSFAEWTR